MIHQEITILSEMKSEEKEKYHTISFTCGIENMAQMNLSTKQKHTHRCKRTELWFSQGKGVGRRIDWEFGFSRCKLLHLEWIKSPTV